MPRNAYKKIIELVLQAAELARKAGIPNLLQPGLVKEMIIADILKHKLIESKRGADACDPKDPSITYEYLSCIEGRTGQFDRMFKRPPEKRRKSLERISRNAKIFLVIFDKENQIKVKRIYEISPKVVEDEANKRLDRSKNDISHIGFSEKWAAKNGEKVYPKDKS